MKIEAYDVNLMKIEASKAITPKPKVVSPQIVDVKYNFLQIPTSLALKKLDKKLMCHDSYYDTMISYFSIISAMVM